MLVSAPSAVTPPRVPDIEAPGATPPAPVTSGPGWTLFDQNTVTGAIVDAIDGAKQVVNAEFFVLADAGKGAQVTNALVNAAKRGVEVNVVTDLLAAASLPVGAFHRMRRRIEDAGGEVIMARNPFGREMYRNPALRHVDHRKVVTVDSTTGFVGGMNFSTLTDEFHDSMMRVGGRTAAELAADQLDRWTRVGGEVTATHANSVRDARDAAAQLPVATHPIDLLVNAPEQQRFDLSSGYVDMIRGAKERVWVTTPGLSDQLLIGELNAAAKRGVDVRVVIGTSSPLGVPVFNWVAHSHIKELTELGGAGYETPGTIHRKVLVVDDEAVLSSFNVTGRSRLKDHEIGIRSSDPRFVDAVAGIIVNDVATGSQIDPATHTGFGARLADLLVQKLGLTY